MAAESLSIIILLSIVVETTTNIIKGILSLQGPKSRLVALFIGIIICLTTQVGILANFNINIKYKLVDYLITGIIISRGSHATHDLISIFKKNTSRNN